MPLPVSLHTLHSLYTTTTVITTTIFSLTSTSVAASTVLHCLKFPLSFSLSHLLPTCIVSAYLIPTPTHYFLSMALFPHRPLPTPTPCIPLLTTSLSLMRHSKVAAGLEKKEVQLTVTLSPSWYLVLAPSNTGALSGRSVWWKRGEQAERKRSVHSWVMLCLYL